MAPKVLLIFCDGTGADGTTTNEQPAEKTRGAFDGAGYKALYATNVLRLSRAVESHTAYSCHFILRLDPDNTTRDGRLQIVFYQSGVGSEANFQGDPVSGTLPMQMFGTAVASKIRDAYAFIAQNHNDGDEICIFGFSRGAYTARKLAGLIDKIGLLSREYLGKFYSIWKELAEGKPPTIPHGTRRTRIKIVGVWDTVGQVYDTVDALSIRDNSLPPSIDLALHAVSLQENRQKFIPTLWTVPQSSQTLKQVFFPGAHCDVGGGYEGHALADLALIWMASEIAPHVNIDEDFVWRTHQSVSDGWAKTQPHNAYEDADWKEKLVFGHETRLESGTVTRETLFHASVLEAPQDLREKDYMITLDTLRKAFGGGWQPTVAPLGKFELECKERWNKRGVSGPEPKFEEPEDLFQY